jgi:hypothetical protein
MVWELCTLPTTVDGKDAIDGTFVMGRNVFLRRSFSRATALNKATDICHGKPFGEQQDERIRCGTPYSVGYDSEHQSFTNDKFEFSNVNDNSDPDQAQRIQVDKDPTCRGQCSITTKTLSRVI